MNLSLRRRQGNHVSKDPQDSGNRPNNGGVQERKNIVSMINSQPGEVKGYNVVTIKRNALNTSHVV